MSKTCFQPRCRKVALITKMKQFLNRWEEHAQSSSNQSILTLNRKSLSLTTLDIKLLRLTRLSLKTLQKMISALCYAHCFMLGVLQLTASFPIHVLQWVAGMSKIGFWPNPILLKSNRWDFKNILVLSHSFCSLKNTPFSVKNN